MNAKHLATSTMLLIKPFLLFLFIAEARADKKSSETKTAPSVATFGEWFAVGSGCRATHKAPGDVFFKGVPFKGGSSITGHFELMGYKLSSPPENQKTSMTFARECNLRVQVNVPPNKKIISVSSKTMIVASKDADIKLNLQNTLYMDTRMVGAYQGELPKGEKVGNREFEIVLSKGNWVGLNSPENIPKPNIECGQGMVFGSDFTVIAQRKSKTDAALVHVGGEGKRLDFSVELEDCK